MRSQTKSRGELAALLAEGDRATITTAIGERLQVRVAEGDGDVVLFVLMLGPGESLDAESPARVLLEFPCVQGIAQVRGDATLADDDLVRFHVCSAIEVVQRRRFFRVRTPRRVDVTSDGGLLSTYSVDISGCGMLMTGPETLETGDQIRFRLHIGDDEIPIEGGARVVRTAADGHRAIEFEQFPRQEEERLIRFLFDRQRAERAITRGDLHKAGGAR